MERWRRGTTYFLSAAPPELGRCCGIDVPALPGWADVWLPALRAWTDLRSIFSSSHTAPKSPFSFNFVRPD